jgi:predicted O-methyltransferase YrrM
MRPRLLFRDMGATITWSLLKRGLLQRAHRRSRRMTSNLHERLVTATLHELGAGHVTSISSWTTPRELVALHDLAASRRQGAVALEIGSYLGASSCYLAAGLKRCSGHLFCVDTWENQTMPEGLMDTFASFQRNVAPFADIITPIRTRSEELNANDINGHIDLAFIDGDHSYDAVATDFALVSGWIQEGGVVAFHDAGVPQFGVTRVVGEALASGEWVLDGIVESLAWLRRTSPAGEQQDIPETNA